MMKCEQMQEWMSERLDGELEEVRSQQLDRHLEACSDCRQEWQLLETTWQAVGEVPELEPGPLFRAQVWAKLRHEPPREGSWSWWRRLVLPLVATAACMTLAVGLFRTPATPAAPAAVAVEMQEIPDLALQDWQTEVELMPDLASLAEKDPPVEDTTLPLGTLSHDYLAEAESALDETLEGM
jgi:anti-sigma factor RsiW